MLNKLVFLSALSVVALSGAAQAATFNPGELTQPFRKATAVKFRSR